jgi:NTE family protein
MSPTVSLVLGSGGARGYAHIGAIEELIAQGFDIRSVAGASMGALVGGVYAAGRLDAYRDFVRPLQRFDVLRMLDWTFSGGGLIKGERIMGKLRELVGEINIDDLPISYTAVAVDLPAQREVWFSRGPLFDAIRASIAIPTLLRPHYYQGRTLVDGGLLNPVPITPTLRDLTDCTIAVDVNGPAESPSAADEPVFLPAIASDSLTTIETAPLAMPELVADSADTAAADAAGELSYRRRLAGMVTALIGPRGRKRERGSDFGVLELFGRSLDAIQETITRFKLAAQPPDLIVRVPRTACAFYDFHRAAELIEIGRERTREALRQWRPPAARP